MPQNKNEVHSCGLGHFLEIIERGDILSIFSDKAKVRTLSITLKNVISRTIVPSLIYRIYIVE